MRRFRILVYSLGTLFLLVVHLSDFILVAFVLSYYSFCHVWLLTFRSLVFSNERQKASGSV